MYRFVFKSVDLAAGAEFIIRIAPAGSIYNFKRDLYFVFLRNTQFKSMAKPNNSMKLGVGVMYSFPFHLQLY